MTTMDTRDFPCARRAALADLRGWFMLGLWIRLAIAGGLAVPAGLLMLADGQASVAAAWGLAAGGGALLGLAFWRARRALARLQPADTAHPPSRRATPPPRTAAAMVGGASGRWA